MTRLRQVLEWLAFGFLSAFLLVSLLVESGRSLVALPELTWFFPLIIAVIVLLLAWPVRAMSQGKKRTMSPLLAARIAAFCQACTRGGAFIAGLCFGTWAATASSTAEFMSTQADRAAWAGIASLALAGAGWLGEYWCSIDDDDEEGVAEGAA